jgi:hypothetical protein
MNEAIERTPDGHEDPLLPVKLRVVTDELEALHASNELTLRRGERLGSILEEVFWRAPGLYAPGEIGMHVRSSGIPAIDWTIRGFSTLGQQEVDLSFSTELHGDRLDWVFARRPSPGIPLSRFPAGAIEGDTIRMRIPLLQDAPSSSSDWEVLSCTDWHLMSAIRAALFEYLQRFAGKPRSEHGALAQALRAQRDWMRRNDVGIRFDNARINPQRHGPASVSLPVILSNFSLGGVRRRMLAFSIQSSADSGRPIPPVRLAWRREDCILNWKANGRDADGVPIMLISAASEGWGVDGSGRLSAPAADFHDRLLALTKSLLGVLAARGFSATFDAGRWLELVSGMRPEGV